MEKAKIRETKDETGGSSQRTRLISLAILFFVNLINYMDRLTVSAVLMDLSNELCPESPDGKCTTSQQGLLQTAFVLVYLAVAPIFGYLGDRYSRKYIMAGGVLVWGCLSLTASFMETYISFLLLRASIAIGESAFTTIAPTVLGDLFSETKRSLVLGIFYLAIPVGSGLGYVVGGAPAHWRDGLRITPGLNFLSVVLILLLLADPPRGTSEGANIESAKSTYMEDLKYISGVKSFLLNVAGFTCVTFTTGALAFYGPNYIKLAINSTTPCRLDSNGSEIVGKSDSFIEYDSVDFVFGAILMVSGILGVLSGMTLSKVLRPRFPRADPFICGVSLLISVPLLIAGLILVKDHLLVAFILLAIGMSFLNMNWSVAVDMTLYVIIPTRRSSAEAIHLMATHALGEAGSPYFIGLLADKLKFDRENDVKCSLAACKEHCDNLATYISLQHAIYLAFALLTLGGILFLLAAIWVVPEKESVDSLIRQLELEKMGESTRSEDRIEMTRLSGHEDTTRPHTPN